MSFFLLVGGAGFIGSNLSLALISSGYSVICADVVPPKFDTTQVKGGRYYYREINICDERSINELFLEFKIDVVFNLASALIPSSKLEDLHGEIANVFAPTLRLVDISINNNVRKIVFFSSGGAIYGETEAIKSSESDKPQPLNYYGWTKYMLEEYLKLQYRMGNCDYIIIRPSNPYGRFQNINGGQGLISVVFGKILSGEPLNVWGDGTVVRDYIYIDDLTDLVISIIDSNKWNDVYNIGSGIGTSVNDIIKIARNITGHDLNVNYHRGRAVDSKSAVLDIAKLQSIVNFSPVFLKDGMAEYWCELSRVGHE